jgi:hypothetical protein
VAVAVGLDHGHQLRALGAGTQGGDIVTNRGQIDDRFGADRAIAAR